MPITESESLRLTPGWQRCNNPPGAGKTFYQEITHRESCISLADRKLSLKSTCPDNEERVSELSGSSLFNLETDGIQIYMGF